MYLSFYFSHLDTPTTTQVSLKTQLQSNAKGLCSSQANVANKTEAREKFLRWIRWRFQIDFNGISNPLQGPNNFLISRLYIKLKNQNVHPTASNLDVRTSSSQTISIPKSSSITIDSKRWNFFARSFKWTLRSSNSHLNFFNPKWQSNVLIKNFSINSRLRFIPLII